MCAADGDIGVALFHSAQLDVADSFHVFFIGIHQHLANDAAGTGLDQGSGTAPAGGADEFHGKRLGRVGDIEQNRVALLQGGRVAGEDFGELFVTRISHVAAATITTARGRLNEKTRARSGEDVADDLAVDIGQAEVAPGVTIGQPFVIEPEQVQNCRVEVVEVNAVLGRIVAVIIRTAVGNA